MRISAKFATTTEPTAALIARDVQTAVATQGASDRSTKPSDFARCIVSTDWMNMEGRLTAFFSQDPVLLRELDDELNGGPKVHSLNAALIYGCKPEEAKHVKINLKGQMVPAYDGGKRLSHGFNYGMGERQMAATFWVDVAFAKEAIDKLSAKYAGVVEWRKSLADRVFGVWTYKCPRCGYTDVEPGTCQVCPKAPYPSILKFDHVEVEGAQIEYTAFGMLRRYPGRRKEGAKALASQHPQSGGASIWNRTFLRLHGYDFYTGGLWPVPKGALVWRPYEDPISVLLQPTPISVMTGTYDSFYVECPTEQADEVRDWLLWTCEQPWTELGGLRLPAEASMGYNMGKYGEENPNGLKDCKGIAPFTARFGC